MICPYCRNSKSSVVDSRPTQDNAIRRRRECAGCHRRFTTYEKIEAIPLRVLKKDGSREPFELAKIRQGLKMACTKRPISAARIEELLEAIEQDLLSGSGREIRTSEIGQRVEQALRETDQIAWFRFRSVHRDIDDPRELIGELDPIANAAPEDDPKQQALFE